MNSIKHLPTPEEAEERAEQARISRIRFKQTLFGGIGAAMIFGLVSVISSSLIQPALAPIGHAIVAHSLTLFLSAPVLGPLAALAGIAAVGMGCVYLGSRFLSKVVTIEQEGQARKIHQATKGKAPEIPPLTLEANKTSPALPVFDKDAAIKTEEDTPSFPAATIQAGSAQWMDKMQPVQDRMMAATAADNAAAADQPWTAKIAAGTDAALARV